MNELFRFSVVRAADRSDASTAPLASPPPIIFANVASPPIDLQAELLKIASELEPERPAPLVVWVRFEAVALLFLQQRAKDILDNPLWGQLAAFLSQLTDLVNGWSDKSSKNDLTSLFAKAPGSTETRAAFRAALADLFLALMIVRRGGPSNLDVLVRSGQLWAQAELLSSKPSLAEVADRIRSIDLIRSGADALLGAETTPSETRAAMLQALATATNLTLLLPPGIFGPLIKPIHGVGFRELHVVKQHIRRYQLAEIGRIENILKGETRSHSLKHTLSNETDTFFQTETTTETAKELSSNDQVDVKNDAEQQVKEDTRVDAAVHASYDGGSYKLATDLNVAYDKSSETTKKFSSDVAKDVTQKVSSKVTQRVTQSQTTKIIETFSDDEHHSFDNKQGKAHISGVYQWVEKVYLAQVFNLGRHMLLDIMVPEPAANVLGLSTTPVLDRSKPVPPSPLQWLTFPAGSNKPPRPVELDDDLAVLVSQGAVVHTLAPDDLLSDELDDPKAVGIPYLAWIGRYGVTGVTSSPPRFTSAGKAITRNSDGDFAAEESLQLPDGYEATTAYARIAWKHSKGDAETGVTTLQIAASTIIATEGTPKSDGVYKAIEPSSHSGDDSQNVYIVNQVVFRDLVADTKDAAGNPSPIVGTIALGVAAPNINQVAVSIEIQCRRLPSLLRQWQLQTYEKIVTAYRQLYSDYEAKSGGQAFTTAPTGTLGAADPESNRLLERLELKRSSIAIIDNNNATVRGRASNVLPYPATPPTDPSDPDFPQLPEPVLSTAQAAGAQVRWFEQAFEWENMAYVFYPYYWGRRASWPERFNLKSDDPLFLDFLKAGYARVVVPVRRGFEWAVNFYLHTGLPWLGGDLPPIGDRTQNPLYLDIAEEIKALTGGPGEVETPIGDPWEYTLPTTLIKLRSDDALPEWHRDGLPSDAPPDAWTWLDGKPKT